MERAEAEADRVALMLGAMRGELEADEAERKARLARIAERGKSGRV